MRNNNLFLFLGIALTAFLLWYLWHIVVYIIIAGVLALIGQPIDRFLGKLKLGKFKLPKAVCSALALVSILLVFISLILFFAPLVAEQAAIISSVDRATVIASLQEPIKSLEQILQKLNIDYTLFDLQTYLQNKIVSAFSVTNISYFFNQLVAILGDFFVAFFAITFITFFFLRDGNFIDEVIIAIAPDRYNEKVRNALLEIQRMLKRYFIGILTEVLLVIIFLSIGLSAAGINHALLIALFAGILNVIPYVGPLIGAGFALFIGLTTSTDLAMTDIIVRILIVFPIVNLADAFLLQPFIYANSVKAHPLEIFLVILIGASIGGIGGMVLAVPSYTIIRVIAKEFFIHLPLVKKITKKLE